MTPRKLSLTALLPLALLGLALAQDSRPAASPRAQKAVETASAWARALVDADLEKTLSLSAAPFAFDGKRILGDDAELKEWIAKLKPFTGEDGTKPGSIPLGKGSVAREVWKAEGAVPQAYVVVRIPLGGDGGSEALTVCVRPGETYRVVGFSD